MFLKLALFRGIGVLWNQLGMSGMRRESTSTDQKDMT